MSEDNVPDFSDVMSIARKWLYTEIRSIAEEAIKELKSQTPALETDDECREWLVEWVDETTDGHQFVIHTAQAGMVLAASDNDNAYEDETGETGASVEAKACCAMRADVWELLEARSDEWLVETDE
jgi:hypothetical protein